VLDVSRPNAATGATVYIVGRSKSLQSLLRYEEILIHNADAEKLDAVVKHHSPKGKGKIIA